MNLVYKHTYVTETNHFRKMTYVNALAIFFDFGFIVYLYYSDNTQTSNYVNAGTTFLRAYFSRKSSECLVLPLASISYKRPR